MKLQIGIDGKIYQLDVEILEDDHQPLLPDRVPTQFVPPTTMQSLAAATPAQAALSEADEAKVCRSPVSGVVIRINAKPGQVLQPDDLIIVLEAMKMETNVTAPVGGTVKDIKVAPGDGVKVNQILVEFA